MLSKRAISKALFHVPTGPAIRALSFFSEGVREEREDGWLWLAGGRKCLAHFAFP